MSKITGAIIGVFAALFAGVLAREGVQSLRGDEADIRSVEILMEAASEINKGMPMMVDAETEIVNVAAAPATIIYNYRLVNRSSADVTSEQVLGLKASVIASTCTTPETRDLLKKGISMRYSYKAKDGTFLASFDVSSENCQL